jgi:type IV secretory pathway ATPase VirB11/archaellum biosynthesis ATPase
LAGQIGLAADVREQELQRLYRGGEWAEFLKLAVRCQKNIIVSDATGSGKTPLTKGLVLETPRDERLIVLEDAAELSLALHGNAVRLLYSKDGQGLGASQREAALGGVAAHAAGSHPARGAQR